MRFVADNTVGKLRRWMSLLGYDVVYDGRSCREILREVPPRHPGRIVLGRCPGLARDPAAAGRFVHIGSSDLPAQLNQVFQAFPIDFPGRLFTRCSHCNAMLRGPLPKEAVLERLPARVRQWREEFYECPVCLRVYWDGTHAERVRRRLREWLRLGR